MRTLGVIDGAACQPVTNDTVPTDTASSLKVLKIVTFLCICAKVSYLNEFPLSESCKNATFPSQFVESIAPYVIPPASFSSPFAQVLRRSTLNIDALKAPVCAAWWIALYGESKLNVPSKGC